MFYVSSGMATAARMPAGYNAAWSPSLYVETSPLLSRIGLVQGVRPAVGPGNPEWIDFADIGWTAPGQAFHCMPGVTMADLHRLRSQISNADAVLFIFGLVFLRLAFGECTG